MVVRARALVLTSLAACGGGGGFPTDAGIDAPVPGGRFALAWTVTDANAQPITCQQIGAQVVSIEMRKNDVQGGFSEAFTCSSLMGTSAAFAPGTYDLTYRLTGLAGELAAVPTQFGIELRSNETTMIDPISFAVDATGKLVLRLESMQAGGNCGNIVQNGAGITNTTITLEHTAGLACEPVTFEISAGANKPAGTYTVNCQNPVVFDCIENDQTLTVPAMPSDNYRIRVRGKIGVADCWTNDDSLVVPPLGKTLNSTLFLAKQAGC